MNNQAVTTNTTNNINNILNSCIKVEESRISRRVTIPRQVHFQLTPEIISSIEQVILNKQKLSLSSAKLADLRYYALLNSPIAKILNSVYPKNFINQLPFEQSYLIFSTNYLSVTNQKPTTVVRSVIDLEGKISQQIQQNFWQNSQLLPRVLDAHYWLILQILSQLPLKTRYRIAWLFWGLFLPIAIMINILAWYLLPLNYLLKIVIICSIVCILKISLQYLIEKHLKPWIIHHLIYDFLDKKVYKRQFGLNLLCLIL
ncbi:hypothetical protein [Pleurocapsa sp. PCC 7319]|uniref:hypothetical protein n=1 Tax=Pleurocapsa sp. PCC 7319 TaxID=118161 RepID=UPI00037C23A9|nr:hypothetical protein [Pleurocapsa sp. PCC 7319]